MVDQIYKEDVKPLMKRRWERLQDWLYEGRTPKAILNLETSGVQELSAQISYLNSCEK